MAKAIESVLSKGQIDSLRINDFIFHIIQTDGDDEKTIFLDSVRLAKAQEDFFLSRLKECAKGSQFLFVDDVDSLASKCENLTKDATKFVEISRDITRSFAKLHVGSSSDGLFVVSVVSYLSSPNDYKNLLFLVKLDKTATLTYSYIEEGGKRTAVINEVPNALSESKQSVQKSALIDLSGTHKWNVLAYDRVSPTLTDYFRSFLGVTERQTASVLTKEAHRAVRAWARQVPAEQLPEGEDANTMIGRSFSFFTAHEHFDTEAFIAAVVRHNDAKINEKLSDELYERLAAVGVAGQRFASKPDSISRREKKQIYETSEGVTITFEGDAAAAGIQRRKLDNGKEIITIETNRVETKVK
ncbi:hypothetical protein SM14VA2_13680 [Serratia marcescens]|nr:hypothetical protein SM14VA2_13680 [Serratia marcescens]